MITKELYDMITDLNTPDIIRLYEHVKTEYHKRKDANKNFRQARWQALNPEKINEAVRKTRNKHKGDADDKVIIESI